jgi:hypothetical protein
MTELEQIEDRVLKLSATDFEEFRKWFREQEWTEQPPAKAGGFAPGAGD